VSLSCENVRTSEQLSAAKSATQPPAGTNSTGCASAGAAANSVAIATASQPDPLTLDVIWSTQFPFVVLQLKHAAIFIACPREAKIVVTTSTGS
jgi:hypothetical protein